MKRVLITVGVLLVLGSIVVVSLRQGGRKKGTRVYVEDASERDIARLVKATGQIDPRDKVNISAPLIAKIERLYVDEGDQIEAGEPFLDLEKEAFRAARDSASAQLSIAESQFRQAEINLQDAEVRLRRTRRLSEEQILSTSDLETAALEYRSRQLGVEQAREAVLQAQASLEKAQDDLRKTTIFAPLTGRVVTLNAEEGEVVVSGTMNNPASVIGTIADLSEILAEVDVDETEVAFLRVEQDAALTVDALPDRDLAGVLVEIGSSGFQRPQQPDVTFFKAKILLTDPDPELRPGMSTRAEINTAESRGALVVPVQSVMLRPPPNDEEGDDDEIEVVFVVEEDSATLVPVETGLSDATHVEILSGVRAGDSVVTGPYRALRDLEDADAVRPRAQPGEGEDEEED